MATNQTFSAMLNEYLPISLLRGDYLKRDWLLTNVEKDDGWKGGSLIVPFKGAQASSFQFGSLAAIGDIAEDEMVRGSITSQPEAWGSLVFNYRDLIEHDGSGVKEKTFLKILPDLVEDFMQWIKFQASVNMLGGGHLALLTADSDNAGTGIQDVDFIDRFELGMKVVVKDDSVAAVTRYVIAIDIDNKRITLSSTRGGSATATSGYTTANNAKVYIPGAQTSGNAFTSLRDSLLSATNGGSSTLYGQTKTAYPYLQSVNVSGSAVTADNILDEIFDAYTEVRTRARGNANKVLMSFKHLGSVMKAIEVSKGGFKYASSSDASIYGWTEIEVVSVKGKLTLVGIQEMPDTDIFFLDMKALKFFSNGMFRKAMSPDGQQYYVDRDTSGYRFVVDICLFGDLVLIKPSNCGILHSISY